MSRSPVHVAIRRYRAEDAPHLAALYVRSVEAIGPRDYSAEQVAAWASLAPSAATRVTRPSVAMAWIRSADAADRPVAFGDLEPDGHIAYLYCAPEAAGSGIASALYDELEAIARAAGVVRLSSEASEAARRLFVRKGFVVTATRRLEIEGVRIHNHAVEKALTADPAG